MKVAVVFLVTVGGEVSASKKKELAKMPQKATTLGQQRQTMNWIKSNQGKANEGIKNLLMGGEVSIPFSEVTNGRCGEHQREFISGGISCIFSSEILEVIKIREKNNSTINVSEIFYYEFDKLNHTNFTASGRLSSDKKKFHIYFKIKKKIGVKSDIVKLTVKNLYYFIKTKNETEGVALDDGLPLLHYNQSYLTLSNGSYNTSINLRKQPNKYDLKAMDNAAWLVKQTLLVFPFLFLVLNIVLAFNQKLHLSGKFLEFAVFCQFIAKLPMLNINFGGYGVRFMDGLMSVDCFMIRLNHPQEEDHNIRREMIGKLAEYSITAMAINSMLISGIFSLVYETLEILSSWVSSPKYKSKAVVRSVLFSILSYRILDIFFYSNISILRQENVTEDPKFKAMFSYGISIFCFIMSMIFLFAIRRDSTNLEPVYRQEAESTPSSWMKHPREMFKILQKVGDADLVEGARANHKDVRYLHFHYFCRYFLLVSFIPRVQENGTVQILEHVITQGIFLVHLLMVVCCRDNVYKDRVCLNLNLIPELSLFFLFVLLACQNYTIRNLETQQTLVFTWPMIFIVYLIVLFKIAQIVWFYWLELSKYLLNNSIERSEQNAPISASNQQQASPEILESRGNNESRPQQPGASNHATIRFSSMNFLDVNINSNKMHYRQKSNPSSEDQLRKSNALDEVKEQPKNPFESIMEAEPKNSLKDHDEGFENGAINLSKQKYLQRESRVHERWIEDAWKEVEERYSLSLKREEGQNLKPQRTTNDRQFRINRQDNDENVGSHDLGVRSDTKL